MNKILSYLFLTCCISVLFSCNKEYSVETNFQAKAEGSLWDSTGNCLKDSVHGTFYNGVVAGSDTAFVEVEVNVTQTGAYNITSDMQNGFQFFDSGFFSETGINTIHLKPIGAAILPSPTAFLISFDSTTCSFTVNVQDSTGTGLGNDTTGSGGGDPDSAVGSNGWQFTTGDGTFQGTFDNAAIVKDTAIWESGGQMLYMEGFKTNSNDSAIVLYVYLPTGAIVPGSYLTQSEPPANSGIFAFVDIDLNGDGDPIYQALPSDVPGGNVIVNIDSYDAATNVVTGTFSGTAYDKDENPTVNVTNGSFKATVTE